MADNNGNSILGTDSKTKVVEAQEFSIRGHLLRWYDTAIQISNISMVSTADLPIPRFPYASPIIAIAGMAMAADEYSALQGIGFLLVVLGIAWAVWWCVKYNDAHGKKYLNISLNSGFTYSFYFSNQDFMRQVLQVFANIFESGTTGNKTVNINTQIGEIRENGVAVQFNLDE